MPGDALENARQRLRPDRIVQRDHFMVFAALLGRDAHMRSRADAPSASPTDAALSRGRRRSRRAGASRHKDLVPHVVQPDQARSLHAIVEVAVHRFPDVAVEVFDRVALRVDAEAERAGRISAVKLVFADFEDDFCPRTWVAPFDSARAPQIPRGAAGARTYCMPGCASNRFPVGRCGCGTMQVGDRIAATNPGESGVGFPRRELSPRRFARGAVRWRLPASVPRNVPARRGRAREWRRAGG